MAKKIVLQLMACKDYRVDELLYMWISYFGLREHLIDDVNQALHWQRVSFFWPLDHYRRVDDLSRRCNVKEKRLGRSGRHQD